MQQAGIEYYVYSRFMFVDIRQNLSGEESPCAEICLSTEQYKNRHLFKSRVAQILAV
jgi:hypothetical protein